MYYHIVSKKAETKIKQFSNNMKTNRKSKKQLAAFGKCTRPQPSGKPDPRPKHDAQIVAAHAAYDAR